MPDRPPERPKYGDFPKPELEYVPPTKKEDSPPPSIPKHMPGSPKRRAWMPGEPLKDIPFPDDKKRN
jgi:hypothetical protein